MDLNRQPNKRGSSSEMQASPEKIQKCAFYLEDYRPVRTIEVTNLPENACLAFIHGYFESTGPVEKVVIHQKTENKEENVAYVTFVRPEDAAKLICDESLQFSFKFSIKKAADMYQPKVDPNILKLEEVNDDCLLHIMSYLNLLDVVNLGKTSIRLQSVARQLYEKKSHFSFGANTGDSSINEINLPVILEEMGAYIDSIEWHLMTPAALDILAKYCPNVTEIKLIRPLRELSSNHFKKNKKFFENLRRLHINNSSLFDTSMKILVAPETLKTLSLEGCHNIRGSFFPKTKRQKLIHIRVINCSMLYYYPEFWSAVKNFQQNNKLFTYAVDMCCSYKDCLTSPPELLAKLKELQLDFSCFLQPDLKQLNFNGLTRLTKLTMTRKTFNAQPFANYNYVFTAIAQINTLESLSIERIEINDDTFNCIGSIRNLKILKLNCVQNIIGKRLYATLPVKLPHLTELSMLMDVPEINIQWICDTVKSLPVLIFFSHSSMTWQLLDMILKVQLTRKQAINVGIPQLMFYDRKKIEFDATSKRSIKLSLNV